MEEVVSRAVPDISISVVSHLQIELVTELLKDLDRYCCNSSFELLLTLNLDEPLPFSLDDFSYPIKLIRNFRPMGFGANHNQAFIQSTGLYFCVLNPDVRLTSNPLDVLLACLKNFSVGVVAPLVLAADGKVEVSARHFPNPLKILSKLFGLSQRAEYLIKDAPIYPDWVGGMFMLFPRHIFGKLKGFDEGYFLYYEDVDICARLRLLNFEVLLNPQACVIHHAQRSSHRSFKYLRWHVSSMVRFFISPGYWRLRFRSLR